MTRKKIEHYLIESYPDSYEDILLADGFDEAFLGVVESNGSELKACYDFYRCIDILIADGAEDYESALDYFYYNTADSYVGASTPAFIKLC